MFNSNTPFTMPVAPVGGNYGNGGNGMWGDSAWWIIVLLIFGWGGFGNGFGGFGGGNGGGAGYVDSALQRGFDNQSVMNKLNGLENGLCDGFYNVNTSLMNGFHGVDTALCNLGYQTQQGFNQTNIALMQGQNALSSQLANCCCEQREATSALRYDMATQACETRHAINDSTRQILDFLTQDKISTLTAENQSLKAAANISAQNAYITANQEAQTAELIRRIAPFAYGYGYGCNNGCGC